MVDAANRATESSIRSARKLSPGGIDRLSTSGHHPGKHGEGTDAGRDNRRQSRHRAGNGSEARRWCRGAHADIAYLDELEALAEERGRRQRCVR